MVEDSAVQRDQAINNLGSDELSTFIRSLITMMQTGGIESLDMAYGDLSVSLRAKSGAVPTTYVGNSATDSSTTQFASSPTPIVEDASHIVSAPMIGTFYVASAPNEPPFVQPGDRVEEGQTIGIIEAMKIMNEIAADRSGTIVEVIAGNAQAVEYGSPLVVLKPDDQ
ncbi:MAG: acetyl-CoA carboxylase biotin carboxyl carrier protein [Thermomicrobiales bacterium]|nr:acetyl-CoA carboxylase biotin carboxyl carrier protein [Thermomicrobiales bacterium]